MCFFGAVVGLISPISLWAYAYQAGGEVAPSSTIDGAGLVTLEQATHSPSPLVELAKTPHDYALVLMETQAWAIGGMLLPAGILSITRHVGDRNDMSAVCLANVLGILIMAVVAEWKSHAMCASLGMPPHSVYLNRSSHTLLILLNLVGWYECGLASPAHGLRALVVVPPATTSTAANASRYTIALFSIFGTRACPPCRCPPPHLFSFPCPVFLVPRATASPSQPSARIDGVLVGEFVFFHW